MTRTLVIQLGRLGDVIQTTPLFADLAADGNEVDVLVLDSVHTALLGCPAVANIITIPDTLTPLDDAIARDFPHGKIPKEASELLAALRLPLYDRVINASHAPLGCWLAAAAPCANPSARFGGIILDRECLYFGAASVYRIAMLQFREQNLFNLVDLIRAIPGIAPPCGQPRLYTNQSADLPFALPPGRRVALNPGASEPARCWAAENFASLAKALFAAGFVPLLVGAPSDRELCEKVAAAACVAMPDFAGRTTIPQMATLLAHCELLVSADTGATHLAAAVSTTVLGLYGATAWFAETAPYGDNHLILQTPLNAPMSAISLDAVLAASLNRLGCLHPTALRRELSSRNQSAWETSLPMASPRSSLTGSEMDGDPLGSLAYRPAHRDSLTLDELLSQSLRRAFAREFIAPNATNSSAMQTPSANFGQGRESHPVAQILSYMETLASLCAESIRQHVASSDAAVAASALIATMDKLRGLAADPSWRPLSPIIRNLDWELRMLPPQSPEQTFRAHAQAYASSARILQRAVARAVQRDKSNQDSMTDEKSIRGVLRQEKDERGDRCLVR